MSNYVDRDSAMAHRRHELLADVLDVAKAELNSYVPEAIAALVASALTDHLAKHWGGQLINFPKDYRFRLSQRDAEIYAEFDGHNQAELAKKHGVGEVQMYRLLRGIRDRLKAAADARNRDLFNN